MTSAALDGVNIMIRQQLAIDGHALIGRTRVASGVALKLTFVNPVCTPDLARNLVQRIADRGEAVAAATPAEHLSAPTDLQHTEFCFPSFPDC